LSFSLGEVGQLDAAQTTELYTVYNTSIQDLPQNR
jgi:hypothetical protein